MTSKEALERLLKDIVVNETILIAKYGYSALNDVELIKQDLERLEQLEDNIKIHKETIKMQHNQIESLQIENEKFKKIIKILKDIFEIQCVYEDESCGCYAMDCLDTFYIIKNKEQYDLLKEYLDE